MKTTAGLQQNPVSADHHGAEGGGTMAGVMDWIQSAKEEIENLSTTEVAAELAGGEVLLLDLREPQETDQGVIPGALLTPRGMLEFYADAATKYHVKELRPDRRVIV